MTIPMHSFSTSLKLVPPDLVRGLVRNEKPGQDCWRENRPFSCQTCCATCSTNRPGPFVLLVHRKHRRICQIPNDQWPPGGVWKPPKSMLSMFQMLLWMLEATQPCIVDLEVFGKAGNEIPFNEPPLIC